MKTNEGQKNQKAFCKPHNMLVHINGNYFYSYSSSPPQQETKSVALKTCLLSPLNLSYVLFDSFQARKVWTYLSDKTRDMDFR